jgi:hypothetical protein
MTVSLVVHLRTITAVVSTVAPGVAMTTGTVTFKLSGKVIGRATLVKRVATLRCVVQAGRSRYVTAAYCGNANLMNSWSVRTSVSAKAAKIL